MALLALVISWGCEVLTCLHSTGLHASNIEDWSPVRIMVVWLALLVVALALERSWHDGDIEAAARWIREHHLEITKAVVPGLVVGIIIGETVAVLMGNGHDWRYGYIFAATGVCIDFLIVFRRLVLRRLEIGFLCVGLCAGFSLIAIMPVVTGVVWDGAIHFKSSYYLSYMGEAEMDGGDSYAALSAPQGVLAGWEGENKLFWYNDLTLEGDEETERDFESRAQTEEITKLDLPFAFERIGNVPAAIGLWLGRVLGVDNITQYTLGRLTNYLTYLLLCYVGIAHMRRGKLVPMALALTPYILFAASNYSRDPWIVCCYILSFSWYVGEMQRPRQTLDLRSGAMILVPYVLGSFAKATYFPIGLVFLIMPRRKLGNGKGRALWTMACLGAAVASTAPLIKILWDAAHPSAASSLTDSRGGTDVNGPEQIRWILANPLAFSETIGSFGLSCFKIPFLGLALGALAYVIPNRAANLTVQYISLIVVALVSLFAPRHPSNGAVRPRKVIGWQARLAAATGVLLALVLSISALYITYNPVGSSSIGGFQPRYMTPLLIPIVLIILDIPLLSTPRDEEAMTRRKMAGVVMITIMAFSTIYLRFLPFF